MPNIERKGETEVVITLEKDEVALLCAYAGMGVGVLYDDEPLFDHESKFVQGLVLIDRDRTQKAHESLVGKINEVKKLMAAITREQAEKTSQENPELVDKARSRVDQLIKHLGLDKPEPASPPADPVH